MKLINLWPANALTTTVSKSVLSLTVMCTARARDAWPSVMPTGARRSAMAEIVLRTAPQSTAQLL